ncbi:uncharacterized protein LOC129808923 [Phlebotomus papatasi]|uniref:uncharacterized protein LOC129808923 n=1 Tax=Phlebotomus papatasi TaxID=29031 RepID=UPI00248435C1|nr:uncharacterized protein LOC129808923 [Phlebotomus papatasi]
MSVNLRTVYAFAREMYPKKVKGDIQYGTAGFRTKRQMETQITVNPITLPTNIDAFEKNKSSWDRWVMRLEETFSCFGITDGAKKRSMILHYMGQENFEKLCDRITPQVPRDLTYEQIVAQLKECFNPVPNEIVEIYEFQKREQREGETCDEYLAALRKMATYCNFGCATCNYLVKALRNQFVAGLKNKSIQKRLLEKRDLTLETALDIAKAMEASQKGEELLSGKKEEVLKLDDSTEKTPREHQEGAKTLKCFRCGVSTHLANTCVHKEKTCFNCNKIGHLASVCHQNKSSRGNDKGKGKDKVQINKVEDLLYYECKNSEKILLNVKLEGKAMTFEVDSGSPISVITVDDRDRFFPNLEIFPTERKFASYNGSKIDIIGFLRVTAEIGGRSLQGLNLYVSMGPSKVPLLGREWSRKLHWLNWNQIMSLNKIKEIHDTEGHKIQIEELKEEFKNVFDKSLGKIVGVKAELKLKDDANPVFLKPRPMPIAKKEAVEREIDKLVKEGAYVKVNQSRWATPIVAIPKASGSVRICGDYSVTVNPNLIVDKHPLPTVEELFQDMAGGDKFSKLDLSQAYMQLEMREEDREILTLNTHKGLYKPTRLMYGVASAVAIWQRVMEALLHDIPGVKVFLDDIRITGANDREHMMRLKEKINYCGYVIDKDGIHKDPRKIEALEKMPRPRNIDEEMGSDQFLAHYDPNQSLVLAVDASPVGVGACLGHRYEDGSEKPLFYASQTLTETQRRYTQIDKEAYAIIFGIKKFYSYLYGRHFILITDNKPLSQIMNPEKGIPQYTALRMQHYSAFLKGFDFTLEHRKTQSHGNADGLSRLPLPETSEFETDDPEITQINLISVLPVTVKQIQDELKKDSDMRIQNGLR